MLKTYNSRIVKLINKKGMLKSSVIIDELPTIYFKGLDNLIAVSYTHLPARSRLHTLLHGQRFFHSFLFADTQPDG